MGVVQIDGTHGGMWDMAIIADEAPPPCDQSCRGGDVVWMQACMHAVHRMHAPVPVRECRRRAATDHRHHHHHQRRRPGAVPVIVLYLALLDFCACLLLAPLHPRRPDRESQPPIPWEPPRAGLWGN
jgi:hypothetical protein